MISKIFRTLGPTRVIALSFLLIILLGTLLLMCPFSTREGIITSPLDALFTSTSATCVTGLVVKDTFSYWSPVGQLILLCLIQIGGIGFMTLLSMIFVLAKRKLTLHERTLLMQSAGNTQLGGMVKLLKRILGGTAIIEGIGAILLSFRFIPEFGVQRGIFFSIFHSVSAFCNAGFDLMGVKEPFSSLTSYRNDYYINIVIMLLIFLGGLGFLVWDDMLKNRIHLSKYSLHSKIILIATAVLLFGGTFGFFIFEKNYTMANEPLGTRIVESFFTSVTMRTAGFNTIDYSQMSPSSMLLANVLMMAGGSPGSTAGGMKITTIALIIISMVAMANGASEITMFKKRLEDGLVKQAAVIILIYILYMMIGTMLICHIDNFNLNEVQFEVISGICTVGVTMGITTKLSTLSHIILIILMYGGRIGGFTLVTILTRNKKKPPMKRPTEKILIG